MIASFKLSVVITVGLAALALKTSAFAIEATQESCSGAVAELGLPSSPVEFDDGFFRDKYIFDGTVECYESGGHLVVKNAGVTVAEDGFYGLESLSARDTAMRIEREEIEALKTLRDKEIAEAKEKYKVASETVELDAEVKLEEIRNGGIPESIATALALEKSAIEAEKVAVEAEKAKKMAQLQEEDREEKRKGFHCLSGWSGEQPHVVSLVERSLNDPDSFEHEKTLVSPVVNGQHKFKMTFRANNGFGALVLNTARGIYSTTNCSDVTLLSIE